MSTPTAGWRTASSRPIRNDSDVNLLTTDSMSFGETVKSSPQYHRHNDRSTLDSNDFPSTAQSQTAVHTTQRQHSCPDGDLPTWSGGRSTGDDIATEELLISNTSSIQQRPPANLQRHSSCRPCINSSPANSRQRAPMHPYIRQPLPNLTNNPFANYHNGSLAIGRPLLRRQHSDSYRRLESAEVDSMGYERPVVNGMYGQATRYLNMGVAAAYPLPYNSQQVPSSPNYAIPASRPFQLPPQGGGQMINNQGNYGIMHRSLHLGQQDVYPASQHPHSPVMLQYGQLDLRDARATSSGNGEPVFSLHYREKYSKPEHNLHILEKV